MEFWFPIVAVLAGVFGLFLSAAVLHKKLKVPHEYTRKVVHIVSGTVAATAPFIFSRSQIFPGLAFLAAGLPLGAHLGLFSGVVRPGRTIAGPMMFLLAYALIFSIEHNAVTVAIVFLVLAGADAAAAVLGTAFGSRGDGLPHGRSWFGSGAFLATAFVVTFLGFRIEGMGSALALVGSGVVGLVAMSTEALSPSWTDNFFVPLSTYIMLRVIELWIPDKILSLTASVVICIGLAAVSMKMRWLTISGALALLIVGLTVVAAGAWQIAILLLAFFASSSMITKFKPKPSIQTDAKTGRGSSQVFALGTLPACMALLDAFHVGKFNWGAVAAAIIAAATADTWATEIGRFSSTSPRLITTGAVVAPGSSGGITPLGLSAAALGAGFVGMLARVLQLSSTPLAVVAVGFAASVLDSVLGATIQANYTCETCGERLEKPLHGHSTLTLSNGYRLVSNELVNLTMSAAAAVTAGGLIETGLLH